MGKKILFIAMVLLSATVTFAADRKFTLVIDAGHGGKDAGCIGKSSKEKDLTLKMALAFGRYVERNCPDVKVVYTRKTDVFVELYQRAEIANRNKADLFISIHINSLPGGKKAYGFQTYTLGRGRSSGSKKGILENLEVAKRENAVITMENDYRQHYAGFDPNSPESNIMFEFIQDTYMERSVELAKLMQRHVCAQTGRQNAGAHQDNLAVLRLSSMPGCLLELGFISTPDEERFLNSADAPAMYARGIYNAFIAYKKKYFGGAGKPFVAEQEQKPEPKAPAEKETAPVREQTAAPKGGNAPVFKVQIIASDRPIKAGSAQFKGVKEVESFKEGRLVKYTTGSSTDYNEIYRLRKQLLEKFPSAFIIAFRNGEKMDVRQAIQEFRANKKQQ